MENPDTELWRKRHFAMVEALETARIREAAALTDEEALRRILSLGTIEAPWRERPDWSGLVEQQAIFMRARRT